MTANGEVLAQRYEAAGEHAMARMIRLVDQIVTAQQRMGESMAKVVEQNARLLETIKSLQARVAQFERMGLQ
jgi:hypothetical protein